MAFHGFSLSLAILSLTCFFGEKKGPSDGIALKGTGYGSGEQLPSSTAAPAKIVYMYEWLFMAFLYRSPFYHPPRPMTRKMPSSHTTADGRRAGRVNRAGKGSHRYVCLPPGGMRLSDMPGRKHPENMSSAGPGL